MTPRPSAIPSDGLSEEPVRRLTILYDERCARCRRWARRLAGQRFLVPVELLPAGSSQARARYPHVAAWLGRELVVVDNAARAWIGPPAFVMCLWAMRRSRWAAALASRPRLAPIANRFLGRLGRRGDHDHAADSCPACAAGTRFEHGPGGTR
jgi:predicted DCC family thiol-disulfide oxidoreductase YuxK